MREQVAVVAQDGAPAQRHDALGRQRFLHDLGDGEHQHRAAGKHDPEQAAPGRNGQQLPAQQRRQDGSQAHDQHQQRHGARRFVGFIVVADDRPWDHDARRTAHGLHHAPAGQRFNGAGQRTPQRGHHEKRQADHQRRLAAKAVGHRPVEHLRQRQADQVGGQRAFDIASGHAQIRRNGRECGQIHVDGERADRSQRAHEDEPAGQAATGNR
ncbi:hypothetical protein D3C87_1486070 [compost metagenome]